MWEERQQRGVISFLFFGYKSVVAVHRRGVPNDIRREKEFSFFLYIITTIWKWFSSFADELRQPRIRLTRGARKPFLPFLIFRIFEILIKKKRKETFTHRILCGGCSTCANKAATNVCVCVYNKTRKKFNPLAFFWLLVSSRKFKKKQKQEKVVEGQLK